MSRSTASTVSSQITTSTSFGVSAANVGGARFGMYPGLPVMSAASDRLQKLACRPGFTR